MSNVGIYSGEEQITERVLLGRSDRERSSVLLSLLLGI